VRRGRGPVGGGAQLFMLSGFSALRKEAFDGGRLRRGGRPGAWTRPEVPFDSTYRQPSFDGATAKNCGFLRAAFIGA